LSYTRAALTLPISGPLSTKKHTGGFAQLLS
jgi:hypothetical protein